MTTEQLAAAISWVKTGALTPVQRMALSVWERDHESFSREVAVGEILVAALTAAQEDFLRLELIEGKTTQGGWRLIETPGEHHVVQLKSGCKPGFATLREALEISHH